jgi:tRNA G18 (ribose-2'-O)-methylase SpoU
MEKIIDFFSRNVIDEYKSLTGEEIKQRLDKNKLPFGCLMEHWTGDFTIGSMLRNANAFGASEVFYLGGSKHWDRRSSLGVQNYTNFQFLRTLEEALPLKSKYSFVAFETGGKYELNDFVWPSNPLLIFGEEGPGITKDLLDIFDYVVSIPQRGSVRSINAACASAIAMYDFVSKHASNETK